VSRNVPQASAVAAEDIAEAVPIPLGSPRHVDDPTMRQRARRVLASNCRGRRPPSPVTLSGAARFLPRADGAFGHGVTDSSIRCPEAGRSSAAPGPVPIGTSYDAGPAERTARPIGKTWAPACHMTPMSRLDTITRRATRRTTSHRSRHWRQPGGGRSGSHSGREVPESGSTRCHAGSHPGRSTLPH